MHRSIAIKLTFVLSASLAAIVVPADVASASPLTVTCTSIGPASSNLLPIAGCKGTGAVSADAGTSPAHGTATPLLNRITWSNHKTTDSTVKVVSSSNSSLCPSLSGYVFHSWNKLTGRVSGGTAKGMIGANWTETACNYANRSGFFIRYKGSLRL